MTTESGSGRHVYILMYGDPAKRDSWLYRNVLRHMSAVQLDYDVTEEPSGRVLLKINVAGRIPSVTLADDNPIARLAVISDPFAEALTEYRLHDAAGEVIGNLKEKPPKSILCVSPDVALALRGTDYYLVCPHALGASRTRYRMLEGNREVGVIVPFNHFPEIHLDDERCLLASALLFLAIVKHDSSKSHT